MESLVSNTIQPYFNNKKIFVTGHTGFKGSWFITLLHLLNAEIAGFALPPEKENELFQKLSSKIGFKNIYGDIRDKKQLEESIVNFQPDFIFHFAAQSLVRRSYQIPSETFDVNVTGTANLLEVINKPNKKCTVIIITTDKVYKNKETNYYYKEDDELGGYDPYSASKAAAEIVVSSFRNSFFSLDNFSLHQKAIASARAGNVIGGGDFNKDRLIPDIIKFLKNNQKIDVRNPNAVRPWQHVLEPLSGYLRLAMLLNEDARKYSGGYNFGPSPDDHLPVKELVNSAIQSWGSGDWADVSNAGQPHEAGLLQLDITKAKTFLNWHPKLTSKEAIDWTISWYKQSPENIFEYTVQQINDYLKK